MRIKNETAIWKAVWQLLVKRNTCLSFYPAFMIALPNELTAQVHTKAWALIFIEALFMIARRGSKRCLSTGESINKP